MQASNDFLVVKIEEIKEEVSAGGIILNISSAFDFRDEFSKKNIIKAEVVYDNPSIPFVKAGDRVVINPQKGTKATMEYEDFTIINKDQYLAKIDKDGTYIVQPDSLIVKISKSDRDGLYSKWIVRNDGTKVQLFIQPEAHKDSTQRSKVYVNISEVIQVGENVRGIKEGDFAILDYTVDNDIDNVLYYDDEGNKYIVVQGTTVLHKCDQWAYATRQSPRNVKVASVNDIEIFSPVLGLIRGEVLIARFPYVFINHEKNVVDKVSGSGILYSEQQYVMEREILSVSEESKLKYGMRDGQKVLVQDPDLFSVNLSDKKIDCIIDNDIMAAI